MQMAKFMVVAGALVFAALTPTSGFSGESMVSVLGGLDSGTITGHAESSVYGPGGPVPGDLDASHSWCGTALFETILRPIAASAQRGAWVVPGVQYGAPIITLSLAASGNRLQDASHDSLEAYYPSAYPVVEPPAEIVHGSLSFYGTDGTPAFMPQSGTAIAETILRPLPERFIDFPRGTIPVMVPEPSPFALLSLGVISLVFSIRCREWHPGKSARNY